MTTIAAIAARLVEAAETEHRLPADGTRPAGMKGYWPEARYSFMDMLQWGTAPDAARKAKIEIDRYVDVEHPDFDPEDEGTWRVRERTRFQDYRDEVRAEMEKGLAPAEVSRFEKCLALIIHHVRRPEDRKAVKAWARSKAGGLPFRKWCRKNGLHQRTAQRRAQRAIEQIAAALGNEPGFLRTHPASGVSSNAPKLGIDFCTLEPVRVKTYHREQDAVPRAHDDSLEAQEAVAKAIAAHNERMRRKHKPASAEIQDARRRKLGLLPEDCEDREAA